MSGLTAGLFGMFLDSLSPAQRTCVPVGQSSSGGTEASGCKWWNVLQEAGLNWLALCLVVCILAPREEKCNDTQVK